MSKTETVNKEVIPDETEKTDEERNKITRELASEVFLTPRASCAMAIESIYKKVSLHNDDSKGSCKGLDLSTLSKTLSEQNEDLFSGDMRRVESMLFDQSQVLQTLFTYFIQNMSEAKYIDNLEVYTRLALKAQNQCRQSLATLGELKNPKRATFIKQQNNAVNQQINQNENSKKLEKEANELLEVIPSERLDTRETQETIGANSELETVATVNGAEDGSRQAQC